MEIECITRGTGLLEDISATPRCPESGFMRPNWLPEHSGNLSNAMRRAVSCVLRLPEISEDELSPEARDNNCPERRGRESAGVDGKVSKCKFAKESHAGGGQPARTGVELSRETWSRLLDGYLSPHPQCGPYLPLFRDLAPDLLSPWQKRYDPHHLSSLEERHCPRP
jgi:hypothetical protein